MNEQHSTSKYKHAVDLMNAAIPYVNSKSRNQMETLIKASELMDTLQASSSSELAACDLKNDTIDLEGLFLNLQGVCNGSELELVNTMLNIVKTRKLYQTYTSMKDLLPNTESGNFTRNKLIPMIEHFFETYQNNQERSV